jgi:hypothetical protein
MGGFLLPLASSILGAGDATPFNSCLGLLDSDAASFRLTAFAALSAFRRRSFSTSFACLSNASFSLCALLRNLGYKLEAREKELVGISNEDG